MIEFLFWNKVHDIGDAKISEFQIRVCGKTVHFGYNDQKLSFQDKWNFTQKFLP